MKKLLTLCAAVLASFSLTWAVDYYTPTVDEEVIELATADKTISTHAAIGNASGTYSTGKNKTCGDPDDATKTKSFSYTLALKTGNGAKTLVLNIAGCDSITLFHDKNSKGRGIEGTATPSVGNVVNLVGPVSTNYTGFSLNPNLSYTLVFTGYEGSAGSGGDVYVGAVKLHKGETCKDPEAHLTFTQSTAYVGDQFSYNYSSLNGGALTTSYTLNGATAEEGTDYTFTSGNLTVLKAGQFVMHRTVDAQDGYCAVDVSDTILINAATAVTACAIEGPTAAYVGEAVTFTATAANASDYAWTVNGVDANTNAAEFTYTPTAAGEYSIVCSARNRFNAANEWIASDAKVLTASNVSGEIIKVELTSGTAATVTGILGGTADVSLSSNKKMDKGKYFGFTLAKGAFAEGDTVIITMSAKGSNYPCLFADKNKETLLYLATETSDALEYKIVLPAAANGLTSLYFARDENDEVYKWNPTFTSVSVIRPKAVKSTSEAFKSVSVNGEALDANFDENHAMNVEGSYVDAPVVVFTKTVTTTYDDDSQAEKDVEVEVLATEVEGKWSASATIDGITYTITTTKQSSFVVTYMDGETKLGTENVAANGNPAEYAQYQSKNLATFLGWYSNADLADEHAVADMAAEVIDEATTYYAKFENKYATSVNIEQLVLDNGTKYDVMAYMGGIGYASNIDNSLDTLNDLEKKDNRNYAYLGLKVKAEGKLLNFRLAANSTVKVKFGNVGATPLVSINGGEYDEMVLAEGVYTYTATAEALISIKTASNATLVFKQIMIDADLADVVLPAPSAYAITLTPGEHGQLAASWEGKSDKKVNVPVGATVTLTVNPAEGYKVTAVTVNGEAIAAVEGVYSFTMPAANVTVSATFDIATALGNTEAEVKAVKRIVNGQLLIEKNGVLYNAQGAVVK